MKRFLLGLVLFVVAMNQGICADNIDPLRALLKLPENKIDLGKAKLTIDRMIDPRIDLQANLKKLDTMTADVRLLLPSYASDQDKLQALRTYIYTAGRWNGFQPYSYDLSDPLGKKFGNKLLSTYLTTKKGNCVSMPILFLVLAQRLGLDVSLATAPEHLFVKYRDNFGRQINLETTSGANPARDIWIRQQNPMTDEAIANGVYMQALNKREAIAEMALTVAEYYSHQHQYEQEIQVSDLVLKYSPKSVDAMVHKGYASGKIIKAQFVSKYPRPGLIPLDKRPYFESLERDNQRWYAKAEGLGWREPTQEQQAKYLQTVEQAVIH